MACFDYYCGSTGILHPHLFGRALYGRRLLYVSYSGKP
nr:MAG TPA: hypothetical protein [Caudoviricetes sp.]